MAKCGDNKNHCHDMQDLWSSADHLLMYCKQCKKRFYVKPQNKKRVAELLKRHSLQPSTNLYYKYYGKMNIL